MITVEFWINTQAQLSMCYLMPYHAAKSVIGFSKILYDSDELLKVVFLIVHTTLWQEFIIHHGIAIKENSGQNLHTLRALHTYSGHGSSGRFHFDD